jgi:sensor histidine kinase YesM
VQRARDIAIHTVAWLLYAANSVLTYPSEYLQRYGVPAIAFKQGTYYAVMAVGFYINYALLAPRLLAEKRYGWYVLGVFILIPVMLGLLLLHALFLDWYFDAGTFFIDDRLPALPYLAFQVLFFTLISTGARFTADWFRMQRLRDELRREKEQAELALLRQQLSPHFLFNTLNNIYSLAVHHPDRAPKALLMLSELMRAVLRSVDQQQSTLLEEIVQLRSYIELKRLQYPDSERIRFSIQGQKDDRPLHPMLLLPFVENAFKHGDLHSEGTRVDIDLVIDAHTLRFTVANTRSSGSKDSTSGIGLRNVRRRLSLLYPGRHMLEVSEPNGHFRVTLLLRFP